MILSPRAVIDIGSNAIRLVVYGGPPRAPMPIYNEKARIALGDCVSKSGEIDADVMDAAIAALVRFDALTRAMQVGERHIIATEATRRATNGAEFLARAADAGVTIEMISGEAEARASALGVVCDMPWAEGYVADQGGGSLELAMIEDAVPAQPISMPFGTIPLSQRGDINPKAIAKDIEARLDRAGGFTIRQGLPLHLVGGAWRALGQLHMQTVGYPLTILSNYTLPQAALSDLAKVVENETTMQASGVVSTARIPFMPAAMATLEALDRIFAPSEIRVSVYGLREGLLFDRLDPELRREDPLIAAARHEGKRLSRFAYHGDGISGWIAPLFDDDPPRLVRLRHAACLLADSAWNSHPEYRAIHAAGLALEGNWPGVTAEDRAILAGALYAAYGGKRPGLPMLAELAAEADLDRARLWGLAVRLAQRLDGGTGTALGSVALLRRNGKIGLDYAGQYRQLEASTVKRRLKQLNEAFAGSTR